MAIQSELFKQYKEETVDQLKKDLNLKHEIQIPKLSKVILNMGLGKGVTDKSYIKEGVEELTLIAGQIAVPTIAKKSNSSFKIREGMEIGARVTLRGQSMYTFVEKFLQIALPRIRDFRGISPRSFDGQGNYSIGIKEIVIFPEIDFDKVKNLKGMDITFVTTAKTNAEALILLTALGFPFQKGNANKEVKNG